MLIVCVGCTSIPNGTFHSNKLLSSKGEEIFINSINWGATDDYQLSIISKDSLRLKERKNTVGAIDGLEPFIYHFKNDTLTLFFYNNIDYKIAENFSTVTVLYQTVNSISYSELQEKTNLNSGYFSVPIKK